MCDLGHQLGESALRAGMQVQFRLLGDDRGSPRDEVCEHDREHLRDAEADVQQVRALSAAHHDELVVT